MWISVTQITSKQTCGNKHLSFRGVYKHSKDINMAGIEPTHNFCHQSRAQAQQIHLMDTFEIHVTFLYFDMLISCLVKSDNHHEDTSYPTGVKI